nr:line-1 retrotransposable element orf2 protein [Quercus suber]
MIRDKIIRAQKARSDWIVQGDRNTKYFQTVVKQRRAQSRILHLKTVDGNTTKDLKVIESTLVEHFRNQYAEVETKSIQTLMKELATLPIPKIDQHQQSYLNSLVTDAEIEKAVYQLGPHKASGPDGIPDFFYKEYWSIVK